MSRFVELSAEQHYRLVARAAAAGATAGPSVVLDVGCGDGGRVRKYLQRSGTVLLGIERLASLAARAHEVLDLTVVADLETPWPVASASIDVVSANQVIEHMARPELFAREVVRVLRPRGVAVISTENLSAWPNVIAVLLGQEPFSAQFSKAQFGLGNRFSRRRGWAIAPEIPHYSVPSYNALRELFQVEGCNVETSLGVHVLPLPVIASRAVLRIDTMHSFYITMVFRKTREAMQD